MVVIVGFFGFICFFMVGWLWDWLKKFYLWGDWECFMSFLGLRLVEVVGFGLVLVRFIEGLKIELFDIMLVFKLVREGDIICGLVMIGLGSFGGFCFLDLSCCIDFWRVRVGFNVCVLEILFLDGWWDEGVGDGVILCGIGDGYRVLCGCLWENSEIWELFLDLILGCWRDMFWLFLVCVSLVFVFLFLIILFLVMMMGVICFVRNELFGLFFCEDMVLGIIWLGRVVLFFWCVCFNCL